MPSIQIDPLVDGDLVMHSHVASDITGLTSHDAVTVTDTSSVDLTLSGQALSATVIPGGVAHNSLGSLQGGTSGQYYHLTSAQNTVVGNTSGTNSGDVTLASPNHGLSLTGQVIGLGTPSSITTSSTNSVTTTTHTHAITGFATGAGSASGANSVDITLGTNTATALSLSGQQLSLADKFVQIAGDTMTGPLFIDGSTNAVQLIVQANGTQTTNLTEWQLSDGYSLAYITPNFGFHGLYAELGGTIPGWMDTSLYINKSVGTTVYNSYAASFTYSIYNPGGAITSYGSGISLSFNVNNSGNAVNGEIYGADFTVTNYNDAVLQSAVGGLFRVWNGDGTHATMNKMTGAIFQIKVQDSTVTDVFGLKTDISIDTGTVTSVSGIYIPSTTLGSGSLTYNYGIYIEDITVGTNKYAILTNAGNVIFNEGGDASTDFRVESDTEANMLFLDANADTDGALYLGGSTNGLKVSKGGDLIFQGTATVYQDVNTGFAGAKVPAANAPTWTTFIGNINAYTFAVNDYIDVEALEVPHGWKEGSEIEIHIHWATNGNNDATVRGVKWEVEYTWANMLSAGGTTAFGSIAAVSTETSIAASEPTLTHKYTSVLTFTPTGGKVGLYVKLRLKRIASVTNTAPASNPFGLAAGIHCELDRVGSRTTSAS